MNATVDIYNQEQITAALGQIKTALDSLISAGIPVDLTGYVRTDHTGDVEIDGDVNIGNDLIVDGDISGGDLEVATALIGETIIPTGAKLAVGGGIIVTNGAADEEAKLSSSAIQAGLVDAGYMFLAHQATYSKNAISSDRNTGGIGGLAFRAKNSVSEFHTYAEVSSTIVSATDGSEQSNIIFYVSNAGALTDKLTVKSNTINIKDIPTSSSGLSTGDMWRDGTTLKIVA